MKSFLFICALLISTPALLAQDQAPAESDVPPTQDEYRQQKDKLKESHQQVQNLKESLEKAKENGDAEATKKAEKELEAAKKERKAAYEYITDNARNQRRKRIKEYRDTKKEMQEDEAQDNAEGEE